MSTGLQLQTSNKQLEAIKRITSQQTPKNEVRWREDRGQKFPYTDTAYVIRTLNEVFAWNWDFEVDSEELFSNQGNPFEIKCRGKLTVHLDGQVVTKYQYGAAQVRMLKTGSAPVTIADMYKAAASDALKKCASLLGIALDLYDSDYRPEKYLNNESEASTPPAPPVAAPPTEFVRADTLKAIENLWSVYGLDVNGKFYNFSTYLEMKKGIKDPRQMAQSDAILMLEYLQKKELAANKPAPAESAPATEVNPNRGAGLDQWKCTQETRSRQLAMDILNATARLEATGVTEDQWRAELNDFKGYDLPVSRKALTAEDARHWLNLLNAWASKREEKK